MKYRSLKVLWTIRCGPKTIMAWM